MDFRGLGLKCRAKILPDRVDQTRRTEMQALYRAVPVAAQGNCIRTIEAVSFQGSAQFILREREDAVNHYILYNHRINNEIFIDSFTAVLIFITFFGKSKLNGRQR